MFYSHTQAFSSIQPPDLINVKPRAEEERKDRYQLEKAKEYKEETRKPRLNLKQSYFEHIQRLTRYNNDVTQNDYSKIVINAESLVKSHKIAYSPLEDELTGKLIIINALN